MQVSSDLIKALTVDNLDTVKSFIPSVYSDVNVYIHDNTRSTLFSLAVKYCSTATVKYLVENGADLKHQTIVTYGGILPWAAFNINEKSTDLIKYVETINPDPVTPALINRMLTNAVSVKNIDLIKYLISKGADPSTALYLATENESLLKILIQSGANLNAKDNTNTYTFIEFCLHRKLKHPMLVELLPDKSNESYMAVMNNDMVALEALHNAGKLGEITTLYMAPLVYVACQYSSVNTIRQLYSYGVDFTVKSPIISKPFGYISKGNETALFAAAKRTNDLYEVMNFLLNEVKLDINYSTGTTSVLINATDSNNYDLVKYLLNNGANANFVGVNGSAGHIAVLNRNTEMMKLLIASGFNLDTKYPDRPDLGMYSGMSVRNLMANRNFKL